MDVLAELGFDVSALDHGMDTTVYPAVVPGRTVHIDADFLAYQVSAEKEGEEKPVDDMKHNAEVAIERLRKLAGAEALHLHLTPVTSNKGGRAGFAVQKEYQGNRKDRASSPRMLHAIRTWLSLNFPATMHENCEADDGMSSAQYSAIASGNVDKSIIASKDKDLNMVPGWHVDWTSGELWFVDPAQPFGDVWLVDDGSKKLVGRGQKWFWAQMLIGDAADNIQGLPVVSGRAANEIKPTASINAAKAILADPQATAQKIERARAMLAQRDPIKCGPVVAELILRNIKNNHDAFHTIMGLYSEIPECVHWNTNKTVSWQDVFVSEARMLWMRRNKDDADDVFKWIAEACLPVQ